MISKNHNYSSTVLLVFLCFTANCFAQGTADKDGVYRPTQEEIAKTQQYLELLRHPTFVTLRLASMRRDNEERSTTPSSYTADQWMNFQLFITQNSTENLAITSSSGGVYREYRPQLTRDGDPVPYNKQAESGIEKAERELSSGSVRSRFVEPGHERLIGVVSLDAWYELPLQLGHYQLTVRKRFIADGDWVESNPVTFDVVSPKTPTSLPNGFKVRLIVEKPKQQTSGEPFHLGYNDGLMVELVNDSDQRVTVNVIDKYYGHRPQLTKDNKLIPYREDIVKLIESKEKDGRLVEVVKPFFLDPQTIQRLDGFSLQQWYGTLAPGTYRLTYRRRFEIGGPWTKDSPELVFKLSP